MLKMIKAGKQLYISDQKYLDSLFDSISDMSKDSPISNSDNDKKEIVSLSILQNPFATELPLEEYGILNNKIQENDSTKIIKNPKNIKNRFWSKTKIITTVVSFLMIVVIMTFFSNISEQLEKEIYNNSLAEFSQNSGKLHTVYSNFDVVTGDWIKYQVLGSSDESGQYTVLVAGASNTYATFLNESLDIIGADKQTTLIRTNDPIDFRYVIPINVKIGDIISMGEAETMKVVGIKTIQVSGINVPAFETSSSVTHSVNDGWAKIDMHNFYDKTTGMLLSITMTVLTNDGHDETIGVYAIDASDHILYPKIP